MGEHIVVYTSDKLLFLPFYSGQSWREKRCEHGKIYDIFPAKWSLYFKTHYKDKKNFIPRESNSSISILKR